MTQNWGIDLAQYVLPEEIFSYFSLKKVEESVKRLPSESVIKDLPVRGKPLYLHVRRRQWQHLGTGEVMSRDWRLVSDGTHYTQGFASFLKGLVGYLPPA